MNLNLNLDTNTRKFSLKLQLSWCVPFATPKRYTTDFFSVSSRNTVKLHLLQWTHTLTLTTLRHQLPQNPATAMLLARVLAPVAPPAVTMAIKVLLSVAGRRRLNDLRMLLLYVAFFLPTFSTSFGKAGA